jgi:Fic family protein
MCTTGEVRVTRLSHTQREDAWIYDLRLLNAKIRRLKGVPTVRTRVVAAADCRGWSYRCPAGLRVTQELRDCLRDFHKTLDTDPAAPALINASARLWLRLMTIRPFMDGNRRTARAFLARCFLQHGISVKNFGALKTFQTTGQMREDLHQCQLAMSKCLALFERN